MFEPTVREEVHIVREVLEGAFSPQLATQVMFEALQQSGAVPGSTEEVLHFCRTGLASVVEEMVGAVYPILNWAFVKERLLRMHWR